MLHRWRSRVNQKLVFNHQIVNLDHVIDTLIGQILNLNSRGCDWRIFCYRTLKSDCLTTLNLK